MSDELRNERLDRKKVEEGVRLILEGIGEDPARAGVADTPRRVAEMFQEIFAGYDHDPSEVVTVIAGAGHDEMIMGRDIPLFGICEHHVTPLVGGAYVAYIPNRDRRNPGLSEVPRPVDPRT